MRERTTQTSVVTTPRVTRPSTAATAGSMVHHSGAGGKAPSKGTTSATPSLVPPVNFGALGQSGTVGLLGPGSYDTGIMYGGRATAGVAIDLTTEGDLGCVTNPGAIAQILTNFVTNTAVHAGARTIRVHLARADVKHAALSRRQLAIPAPTPAAHRTHVRRSVDHDDPDRDAVGLAFGRARFDLHLFGNVHSLDEQIREGRHATSSGSGGPATTTRDPRNLP